eukprot:3461392-Pyramimonas_sp.AAC.1
MSKDSLQISSSLSSAGPTPGGLTNGRLLLQLRDQGLVDRVCLLEFSSHCARNILELQDAVPLRQ